MKKNYFLTIFLGFVASLAIIAQNDLAISIDGYTNNQTLTGGDLNLVLTITNNSSSTMNVGDSIFFAFIFDGLGSTIDGVPAVINVDQNTGAVSFAIDYYSATLTEALEPDSSASIPIITLTAGGISLGVCGIVSHTSAGMVANSTFPGDDNPADNEFCLTYDVTSIEEDLKDIANTIYVYNNQLILENNSSTANTSAEISIINLTGQTVQTEQVVLQNGTMTLPLNNLTEGIYVVSMNVGGFISSKKVLVK